MGIVAVGDTAGKAGRAAGAEPGRLSEVLVHTYAPARTGTPHVHTVSPRCARGDLGEKRAAFPQSAIPRTSRPGSWEGLWL